MFSDRLICCVPGCTHSASRLTLPECVEVMCEAHYALASPQARARRARSEERLRAIQARFDDEAVFERAIAAGKYLKLCSVLSAASDKAERSWHDVKAEVLAAAQARGAAEVATAA
jgi:hypothetical protein